MNSFSPIRSRAGFTLAEMLTVIAIMVLLMVFALPALNSVMNTRGLAKTGNDISKILEQAKAYAMAQNTYVWVGFKREGDDTLVVGTVASKTGSATPGTAVTPLGNLVRFEKVKIVSAPNADSRPGGNDVFQLADASTPSILTFTLGPPSKQVTFGPQVIQWNGRGEPRLSSTQLHRVLEIGLQTFVGNINRSPEDYVAIQISGLPGAITVYRP